jgi:hypothetical protein
MGAQNPAIGRLAERPEQRADGVGTPDQVVARKTGAVCGESSDSWNARNNIKEFKSLM